MTLKAKYEDELKSIATNCKSQILVTKSKYQMNCTFNHVYTVEMLFLS